MKIAKQLILKSFMLASVFLFISCSSDDDNNNNATPPSIFGAWKYIGYVEEGEFFNDQELCYSEILTINNNNTGLIEVADCDFGNNSAPFTWENISDNKYSFTALGTTETVFITFPSGSDNMHLTVEGDPAYSDVYQRQ